MAQHSSAFQGYPVFHILRPAPGTNTLQTHGLLFQTFSSAPCVSHVACLQLAPSYKIKTPLEEGPGLSCHLAPVLLHYLYKDLDFRYVEMDNLNRYTKLGSPIPIIFQTEWPVMENNRMLYRMKKSPLCNYMINFIHKLRGLPAKTLMNNVLENFTVLQV